MAQLRHGRYVQASVQIGDHTAGLDVGHRRKAARLQAFEQQRAPTWVGPQQTRRAVTSPPPKHKVLLTVRRIGPADLEHGRQGSRRAHRHHEGTGTVDGWAVGAKIPLLHEAVHDSADHVTHVFHRRGPGVQANHAASRSALP